MPSGQKSPGGIRFLQNVEKNTDYTDKAVENTYKIEMSVINVGKY